MKLIGIVKIFNPCQEAVHLYAYTYAPKNVTCTINCRADVRAAGLQYINRPDSSAFLKETSGLFLCSFLLLCAILAASIHWRI